MTEIIIFNGNGKRVIKYKCSHCIDTFTTYNKLFKHLKENHYYQFFKGLR